MLDEIRYSGQINFMILVRLKWNTPLYKLDEFVQN